MILVQAFEGECNETICFTQAVHLRSDKEEDLVCNSLVDDGFIAGPLGGCRWCIVFGSPHETSPTISRYLTDSNLKFESFTGILAKEEFQLIISNFLIRAVRRNLCKKFWLNLDIQKLDRYYYVPPAHYNGVSKGEFLSCEVFFDIKWTSAFHFRVEVFAGNSFNSRFSRYIPFSDAAFASHSVCVLPYINGWKVVTERVSDVDAALQESKTEKTLRVRYKDDFRSSTSRPMSKNELLWFFKTQYGFQFETDPEFVMVQEGSLTSIPRCDMVSVNIGLKSQSLFGNQTQNYPSLSESELLIVWTQAKEKLYAVKEVQRIKKQKVISEKPAAQIVIPRFKKRKVASEKSLAQSVPEKSNNQHKRPVQKKPFNEREPIKMIDQTALKKGNDKEKSPVTLEALVEKEPSEEGTFKTMKIAQLKEYLRSRNQKVSGNKTILLERIQSIL